MDSCANLGLCNPKNLPAFNNILERKNLCLYCDREWKGGSADLTECRAFAIP